MIESRVSVFGALGLSAGLAFGVPAGAAWAAASQAAGAEAALDGLMPEPMAGPEADAALTVGRAVTVAVDEAEPSVLSVTAAEPGLLTVVGVSEPRIDLTITVTDRLGQEVIGGDIDVDPVELPGGETGVVALPRAGDYLVLLESLDGAGRVRVESGWIPMPEADRPADPNGGPDDALPLRVGVRQDQSFDSKTGDLRDWYVIEPARSGLLRVQARTPVGSETDLILERYTADRFWESEDYADNDEGEVLGHESLELAVNRGQPVFIRVSTWSTLDPEGQAEPYTLTARWAE
ncbi:MAG: hypothetical protein AAF710_02635 [Planctomycetota bacterium]